jgi:hypothetical protein
MKKILHSAALAAVVCLSGAATALAAAIPADTVHEPKRLWRMVMETYYGPYDKALKCWVARLGEDRVCMRPHRLDQVTVRGRNTLFLVIGGSRIGDDGELQQSHADSGRLGLVVLAETGRNLDLVARNDLKSPFGTFGALPAEDAFAVREIGPNETYGWVAEDGWMGQGVVITYNRIFAPVGDKVVQVGDLPSHYDNSGNCEEGKVIGSDTPCTDYSGELLFDSAASASRFYPIILKVTGSREGVVIDRAFTTEFDPGTFSYRKIEGLPEEFANGI